MVLDCVHDHMEQCNCSTCIGSILFHVKKVGRDFVVLKVFGLLLEEYLLLFVYFVEEDNTQNRFDEHVLGPFFERKEFLD